MTDIARRPLTAVMLLLVAALLSGCIVCIDDIGCCDRNPRQATLYVYVRDYYSGASISWAYVELYESEWWSWDHVGTWDVDRYGYARVRDGYLYCDDCGHQEEQFLVVVRASGYYSEDFEIELSYYHPSETLTFYLMPYYGREGDSGASAPDSAVRIDHHNGRVVVGVPVEEGGEIPTVDDGERTPATGERGTD